MRRMWIKTFDKTCRSWIAKSTSRSKIIARLANIKSNLKVYNSHNTERGETKNTSQQGSGGSCVKGRNMEMNISRVIVIMGQAYDTQLLQRHIFYNRRKRLPGTLCSKRSTAQVMPSSTWDANLPLKRARCSSFSVINTDSSSLSYNKALCRRSWRTRTAEEKEFWLRVGRLVVVACSDHASISCGAIKAGGMVLESTSHLYDHLTNEAPHGNQTS